MFESMETMSIHCRFIFCGLFLVINRLTSVTSLTAFCPVVSPFDENIFITDQSNQSLADQTKTQCALKCRLITSQNSAGDACRYFNYNSTSMNCSLFNYEPTKYAVDSSGYTITYQVNTYIYYFFTMLKH